MGFDLRGASGFRFASTGEKEITLLDKELFETFMKDSVPYDPSLHDQKVFTIEPYVGALPLRFGMKPDEVASHLGPPDDTHEYPQYESFHEHRGGTKLGYLLSERKLTDIVFTEFGHAVVFNGHALFDQVDLLSMLRQYDPQPYKLVGFIFFTKLGMRLSGFDTDNEEKAIAIVSEGGFDEYFHEFEPYDGP
jgi:hypothetical protein